MSNNEGETALHVAAVRGYYTIVRFLCSKGANMDAQDKVCVSVCEERGRERERERERERTCCAHSLIYLVMII